MGHAAQTDGEARPAQQEGQAASDFVPQAPSWKHFPFSLRYLLASAFGERYVFYGVKAVLALYLYKHLNLGENTATELFHLFVVVTYTTTLLGAYLSDGLWVSIAVPFRSCWCLAKMSVRALLTAKMQLPLL